MQGSGGLVLTQQLQIYCCSAGMNLKRGVNPGHGLTGCCCLGGKGGGVTAGTQSSEHTEGMIQAKTAQILQQI